MVTLMDDRIKEKLEKLVEPKVKFIYDENIVEDELER